MRKNSSTVPNKKNLKMGCYMLLLKILKNGPSIPEVAHREKNK